MKVLRFPSRPVLEAVDALEQDAGHEVDELAASILVRALNSGETVPTKMLTLLVWTPGRNVGKLLFESLAPCPRRSR